MNKELSETELTPHCPQQLQKSPRYILLLPIFNFSIFLLFKVLHYSFNFHFCNLLPCKKTHPISKANFINIFFIIFVTFLILYFWESNIYSRFLIFAFCHQFCTFKYPILSTHFYLAVWLLAWLPSSPFDYPFSPPGHLYLLPTPSLLYPTLWIFLGVLGCGEHLGNWLLARLVSLLLTPPLLLLATFLPPPSSLLYVTPWTALSVPDSGEHIGNWLLARLLSPLLIPPFLFLVTSIYLLPLLFSM